MKDWNEMLRQAKKMAASQSESWLTQNTKPCTGCGAPHPEERRLQSYHLLTMPWTLLLGRLLPYTHYSQDRTLVHPGQTWSGNFPGTLREGGSRVHLRARCSAHLLQPSACRARWVDLYQSAMQQREGAQRPGHSTRIGVVLSPQRTCPDGSAGLWERLGGAQLSDRRLLLLQPLCARSCRRRSS